MDEYGVVMSGFADSLEVRAAMAHSDSAKASQKTGKYVAFDNKLQKHTNTRMRPGKVENDRTNT